MFRSSMVRQLTCSFVLISLAYGPIPSAAAEELAPSVRLTGKTGGLTADVVARKASTTSLSAAQKQHDVQAAQAELDRALYDFFPRLSLSASYARLSKVDGPSLGNVVMAPAAGPVVDPNQLTAVPLQFQSVRHYAAASASLDVPVSDYVLRLFQARAAVEAQLKGSQFSLDAARRKAAYDGRALYYDWVKAELNAAVAEQNLTFSRENFERVQALQAADSASAADVARVEATLAASELVVVQAKNLAALQRERIGIAMHDGATRDYVIGEDLTTSPAIRPELDDMPGLIRSALSERPELRALSLQARAYDKQADVARSIAYPRLDANAQATYANPNQRYFPAEDEFNSSWQVGLQLSYAPNDTLSGLAQARAAQAKSRAVSAQRVELSDALRSEVTEAVLAHRNALASLTSSARRAAAADTSYHARRERFLADKATTVELTEAQTELFNARLEAVQAQVSVRLARARIAYVAGRDR